LLMTKHEDDALRRWFPPLRERRRNLRELWINPVRDASRLEGGGGATVTQ
jgi:ribosomal protein L20